MRRKYYFAGALALSLILCGFIGCVSISSAFTNTSNTSGGAILACYNSTPGAGSVKLNGQQISSNGLLSVSNGNCPTGETSVGLAGYRRTIPVSPNGTPAQNGTALLEAMTAITNGETSLTLDDVNLTVSCPLNATGM